MQPEIIWSEVRRSIHRTIRPRARRLAMRAGLAGGLILVLLLAWPRTVFLADDPEPPKSIRMASRTRRRGASSALLTAQGKCRRRGRAPYHVHPRCRLPRKSRNEPVRPIPLDERSTEVTR